MLGAEINPHAVPEMAGRSLRRLTIVMRRPIGGLISSASMVGARLGVIGMGRAQVVGQGADAGRRLGRSTLRGGDGFRECERVRATRCLAPAQSRKGFSSCR